MVSRKNLGNYAKSSSFLEFRGDRKNLFPGKSVEFFVTDDTNGMTKKSPD